MKDNNIGYLVNKLREKGLIRAKTYPGALQVVHYWIRTGKLKLRQMPHSGYYIVNDNEAESILKEFNVGGRGWYSYEET